MIYFNYPKFCSLNGIMFANFLYIHIYGVFILEPLSIISVIFQLASAAPQIDQFLSHEENKVYSRTETIEIYRKNMNIDVYKNNSD